jgi:hypothetical protein
MEERRSNRRIEPYYEVLRTMYRVLFFYPLICLVVISAAEADFYVDGVEGSDMYPGTEPLPFQTLERARDAIRIISSSGLPEGGVTVWIRGGLYERTSTFTLSSEDSGEAGKPIVYRAYPGEEVRIAGGKQLQPEWFTLVTAAASVWGRLDEAAKGNVMEVNLAAHGITDYGILRNRGFGKGGDAAVELFFGDEAMQLARWPNDGFENVVTVPNGRYGKQFTYSGTRPERWALAEEPLFFGYWYYGWAELYSTGTIDANTATITLDYDPQYGIKAGAYWYALNLLEEIDMPGEWYLNRSSGILYFWPPAPLENKRIAVSTSTEPLVELEDVSYVRFDRLIFELGWTTLVGIDGGEHNLISNCVVRNGGTDGINVSGENNRVICCEVHRQGNKGVVLSGGDRYALTPCGNGVHNCHIHHFGRWCRTYRPAVHISAVGVVVSHNLMHDGPHSAILTGRNENLIEYNRIHDVCKETNDSGSIYTGRDWGSRGNIIRYNFFHHISTEQVGGLDVHAVYLDDCSSSHRVFGNVFYEVSGRAIMCGGGRDNIIENNVIVKCGAAHFTDRRGVVKVNDISGDSWNLLEKINKYNYTQPPWSTAYPLLAAIMDEGYEQAKEPKGNVIARNIGWQNDEWLDEGTWGGAGGFGFYTIESNIEDADPKFVDESSLNLELLSISPAFLLPGFEAIPFTQIGRSVCSWDCDIDGDDDVDFSDTSRFASRWGDTGCDSTNGWCLRADITRNGSVGMEDLSGFVGNWLASTKPPQPGQASNPEPGDEAIYVSRTADLSWTGSTEATSYDVYFGTTTGPGTYQGNQTSTTFDPGTMAGSTNYYWRVDSVNDWGKTVGKVWNFATELSPPP